MEDAEVSLNSSATPNSPIQCSRSTESRKGRKQIAKPLTVLGAKLFFSEQCKNNFEGAAGTTKLISTQHKSKNPARKKERTESKAKGGIKGKSMEKIELTKPIKNMRCDAVRITDYPQVRSPQPMLPRYHAQSVISESSINSDGTSVLMHDARKKPKKKILKNPQHIRKQSKNRVRWNLPEENSFEMVTPTVSTESTSTSYKVNRRLDLSDMACASKQALKVQPSANPWGNTELNVEKHHHCHLPHLHHEHYNPKGFTRSASCNFSSSSAGASLPTHAPSHSLPGGSLVPSNQTSMHSSNSLSASSLPPTVDNEEEKMATPTPTSNFQGSFSDKGNSYDDEEPYICDANLTIKYRSKIVRSNSAPAGKLITIDKVDARDYDHLNPLKDKSKVSTSADGKERQKEGRRLKYVFDNVLVPLKGKKDSGAFLEQDIDNPLSLLAKESCDNITLAPAPSPEKPPPIPPKKRKLYNQVGKPAAVIHKVVAVKEKRKDKSNVLPLPAMPPKRKNSPSLFPKPEWRKPQDSDYNGKPLRENTRISHSSSQSTEQLSSSTKSSNIPPQPIKSETFDEYIVPPPAKFSGTIFNSDSNSDICRIGCLDQLQEKQDFSGTKQLCRDVVAFSHQSNSSIMVHASKMVDDVGAKTDQMFDGRHIEDHHARSSGIMTEQLFFHQDSVISSDKRCSLLASFSPVKNNKSGGGMASDLSAPWKSDTEMSSAEGNFYRHLPPSNIPLNSPSIKISHHTDQSRYPLDGRLNAKDQSLAIHRPLNHPSPPPLLTHSHKRSNELTQKMSNRQIKEEQCAFQRIYPTNGKFSMKTTGQDTGKHIQEMFAEINIDGRRDQRVNTAFGLCGKCGKSIASQKDLWSHDGLCYHIRCFHCALCSISLQGRTTIRVRTRLLCSICHTNFNSSPLDSGASHHLHQSQHKLDPTGEYQSPQSGEYHRPPISSCLAGPTGGKITFV